METTVKKTSFRMLMLIAPPKQAKKAEELFRKGALPLQYRFHGEGTASSEIMDMLGLGSIDKIILISMMPKQFADKMLEKLRNELKLHTANSGIAFTLPLSGANNLLIQRLIQLNVNDTLVSKEGDDIMSDAKNVLIATIVDRGFSEKVMESARAAGAKGGTVIHSRQISNEEITSFWGVRVQDEKEIVLILSDAEAKVNIMQAVGESCGAHSDAHGIIMSLPIDSVIGI